MGVVLLLSCFVALGVVSRLNRKVILVCSILGMSVCQLALGSCFHFYSVPASMFANITGPVVAKTLVSENLGSVGSDPVGSNPVGWLPLVAVLGFLFLGNVGYGTLIWVVTAELLPSKV